MSGSPRRLEATLLLVGTIVGVGMFGIPFVFSRAGFLTGLVELTFLAIAAILVHLAYAEVVLSTPELHRLPGYVTRYLGRNLGRLSQWSYLFGLSGSLLAYLALGGFFLGELIRWLIPAAPATAGPAVFYAVGASVILRSIRVEGLVNAVLTTLLMIGIVVLAVLLLPFGSPTLLSGFHPERLFLPYGVILFAMAGSAIIPDMRRLWPEGGRREFRSAVIIGTAIPALLYVLFAAAVVGLTGEATTPDAVSGVAGALGTPVLLIGSLIGFLATITSFITLGVVLEGTLVNDLGLAPVVGSATAIVIPAALYLAGFHDFLAIISVVGAVAIGLDSILILLVHRRFGRHQPKAPEFKVAMPPLLRAVLIALFAVGILAAVLKPL